MVSLITVMPYWIALLVELAFVYNVHLALGLSMGISACRLLMIIQFDKMIQFEPEKFCHSLLTALLILTVVIIGYPAYYTISRGVVGVLIGLLTGLDSSSTVGAVQISFIILLAVTVITTVGSYLYGKYYLKKHHSTNRKPTKII
ncbi:uncharacterized protein LOC111695871 [Eurytemora carolleeae]|uniref:uncharacterized protein LOC111695871 n=1 Tax=Eurytemora carolleeae TaxID=1294199 RepID=UPI000C77B105|nr:uncharacterized protein LOC111695871 [Eurytemora carolleeae]|eukprot:XP_023321103.1 uncharacterized protein LOC111695871 [Eurytemora affinis]